MVTGSAIRFVEFVEKRSPLCPIYIDREMSTVFFDGVRLLAFGFWSNGFAGLGTRHHSVIGSEKKSNLIATVMTMLGRHEIKGQKIDTSLVNSCMDGRIDHGF